MTTYATFADMGDLRPKIEASMFQGEEFLGAMDTWHLFRVIHEEILILTDQRVILYKKGMIRESTTDYDRDRITKVSFDKGIFRRKLTISGSGFSRTWRVPRSGGQAFAAAIRAPEPQPVYAPNTGTTTETTDTASESSSGTVSDTTATASGSTTNELPASSRPTSGTPNRGIGAAQVVNPGAEKFGFDRWHYVTAAGFGLLWVTAVADISAGFLLFLVVTGVAMYIDIMMIREATTWQPRAWLYELGVLFGGLGAVVYLINRYRVWSSIDEV